jgi:hypothetical protein
MGTQIFMIIPIAANFWFAFDQSNADDLCAVVRSSIVFLRLKCATQG